MTQSAPVLYYRVFVFAAASFYLAHNILTSDYSNPGGSFRFLTIWGLTMAFICAGRVLLVSLGRASGGWDAFVSATVVVNAMVVFLYWKLYFEDPASVTRNGQLAAAWKEYYLHLSGPILLWIDALFLNRVFQRLGRAALWLSGIIIAYLSWAELFVARFNDTPVGSVTSGLPYPFLNNLDLGGRISFYVTNIVVALILLAVFAGLAWIIRRFLPRP